MTDSTSDIHESLRSMLKEALASARADRRNAPAITNVAERILRAGFKDEAVAVCRGAVLFAPEDVRVLRAASAIVAETGDFQTAASYAEQAVQLSPGNAELRLQYAVVLLYLNESQKSAEQLEYHLELQPDSAIGWRNLSSAIANLGDFSAALEAASKSVTYDPDNAEFRIHRAALYSFMGRYGDALRDLEHAETVAPENGAIPRVLSNILDSMSDLDAAINSAAKAVALAPENDEYKRNLEALSQRRMFVEGAAQKTKELRLSRDAEAERIAKRLIVRRRSRSRWAGIDAVRAQSRIIFALVLREMRTRFGETQIGFAWALIEPISHLALIAVVFSATNFAQPPVGDNILVYYFSGVVPYLLFVNTSYAVTHALLANEAILQIPLVTFIDVLAARSIVELVTQVAVGTIMLTAFGLFGLNALPSDILTCASAVILIWLTAAGIGFLNAIIIHFIKSWDHIYSNLTRAMYFLSGIFVSPNVMSNWLLDILSWNPLLQGIEWFRSGFYSDYHPPWLDKPYLMYWSLICVTLGLAAERVLRRELSVRT